MAKLDPDGESRPLRPGIGMSILMDEHLDPSNPLIPLAQKDSLLHGLFFSRPGPATYRLHQYPESIVAQPALGRKSPAPSIPAKHVCRTWHCVRAGSVEVHAGADLDVMCGGRSEAESSMGKIH